MLFPCKDCPHRYPGCHDHCDSYGRAKEEHEKIKAMRNPDDSVRCYVNRNIERTMDSKAKRARANKGISWFRKR
jgi:hypothetical protein